MFELEIDVSQAQSMHAFCPILHFLVIGGALGYSLDNASITDMIKFKPISFKHLHDFFRAVYIACHFASVQQGIVYDLVRNEPEVTQLLQARFSEFHISDLRSRLDH